MFKNFLTLSLLLIMISPVLVAQDETKVKALLSEADACIGKNLLPEALDKTKEALQLSSGNLLALQKQISILFLMKNDKEAMRQTEEAISRFPNEPDFYYFKGVINNSREKYERALNDFDRGIAMNPTVNLYKYYLGRGVSHLNLLEYDLALADFTSTIEMNDTVASAYHSRAMANYELHDYTAAVTDFLKALEYTAGNSALYFNLGMSYYRLNEKAKACPYFHKACTLGNTNACRMALMECAKSIPAVQ
jgi:tetratricopeptide (TPR) repeat protein